MPRATVEAVEGYEVDGRTVELECSVTVEPTDPVEQDVHRLPDRTRPLELRFYAPDVFRFEFQATPAVGATAGLDLDVEAVAEPVTLETESVDGELRIHTDALTVAVGLDPWSFEVRRSGEAVLAEQRGDATAKGQGRVEPLGYTLEETNRWPLRATDTGTAFTLRADEHVYGLGEKFTEFDKRGQRIESWVTQPNGTSTEHAYKNVPLYLSTAGYGLLVDTYQRTTFDVGATSVASLDVTVADDTFAFVFFGHAEFKAILERYTALTGRAPRVPKWSFGVWMSRCAYRSRAEIEDVLDRLAAADLPCDVVHIDPGWLRDGALCDFVWDREAFPDPEGFIEALHDRDVRVSLWEYPYIQTGGATFEEARDRGYLVEDGRGKPYVLSRLSWGADEGAIVDFTDPEAAAWWAEQHRSLLEMGVDVFKTDFGEYLPTDAVLADGSTGRTARNRYPNLYLRTVYEAMAETLGEGNALLWARPGWAGGQRYPVHWGGDPNTTFEAMAASLRGGLSLALSGYAYWSVDIGGFHGEPSTELYVRWAQLGLLGLSHARFHGTTPREPYHYGEDAVEIVRELARERYRLLPYLLTQRELAARRGWPVMRPLVFEFQDDHGARTCGTQHLLGDALMVAPVLSPGPDRDVYLPPGEWVDYWDHDRHAGGRTLHRTVPLEECPLYLRAGRIVPTRPPTDGVPETAPETLTLRAALADGHAEGPVYDEATGTLATVRIDREGDTLRIEGTDLSPTVRIELLAVGTAPETVRTGERALTRVRGTPGPGEWTVEDGTLLATRP